MLNRPKRKIRLTGLGNWLLFLSVFLLFAAQNTGNNLLYLVCSCVLSVLFLGVINAFFIQYRLKAELVFPEVVISGHEAEVICKAEGRGNLGYHNLRFEGSYLECIPANSTGYLKTSFKLNRTGRYIFKNFSLFNISILGLFYSQIIFPDFVIYAVENYGTESVTVLGIGLDGRKVIKTTGREGEFWAHELYQEGEDSSRINWSVSARSLEEWVTVRSKLEEEPSPEKESKDEAEDIEKTFSENIEVNGKRFIDLRNAALEKELSPYAYRLVVVLSMLACLGIYTTGFLITLLPLLFISFGVLLIKGHGFHKKMHKIIYYASFFVVLYILGKSFVNSNSTNIVLLLEFAVLTLFIQLLTLSTIRDTHGAMNLILMIFLGIGAMNVNSAFPIVFLPYLTLVSMVLSFFRFNTICNDRNVVNRLMVSSRGISTTFLLMLIFSLVWIPSFYLIPRTSYGLAAEFSNKSAKGFSGSTLSLNDSGFLEDNMAVVMRIKPTGEKTPLPSVLRRVKGKLIRGGAFDKYDGGEWKKSSNYFYTQDLTALSGEFNYDKKFSDSESLHSFEVALEGLENATVFIPEDTKKIKFNDYYIGFGAGGSVFFADGKVNITRKYNVSMLIDKPEIKDSTIDEIFEDRRFYRFLPFLSLDNATEGIRQISKNLMGKSNSISKRVEIVKDFLNKNYSYSLNQPIIPEGRDPVDYFLFENKAGTCQHFASAMVLLLRGMNVPCRIVNGYMMGEWNEVGGFFTVRQSHAHAWVEVLFPSVGWVSFDPTPLEDGSVVSESSFKRITDKIIEFYEGFWFNYVYGIGLSAQGISVKKFILALRESMENVFGSKWFWRILVFSLIFFMAFKNYLYAFYIYWSKSFRWIPFSYILWEVGIKHSRNTNETPREFHNRLATDNILSGSSREILAEVENLIDDYAFNPKSDKIKIAERISSLLKGVQL